MENYVYEEVDITDDIDGSLEQVMSNLEKARIEYLHEGFKNSYLSVEKIEDRYGEERAVVLLCGHRVETDDEKKVRLEKNETLQKKREADEFAQFLKLKEKYGECPADELGI